MGRNAILGGFQGQRQWTDHAPNGDFMEAILNSSFDWNGIRAPHIFATENDSLNGATMLLSLPAHEPGPDLRGRPHLLEPRGGRAGHRPPARRPRGRRLHPPHQLRRSHPRRHGRDDGRRRQARDEAVLGDHRRTTSRPRSRPPPGTRPTAATSAAAATPASSSAGAGCPSRWRASTSSRARVPCSRSPRAGPWSCRRRSTTSSTSGPTRPGRPTGSCRGPTASGPFRDVYTVMANWAANHGAISYGHIGADLITPGLDPADPGPHAQRGRGGRLPALRLGEPGHGRPRGRGLPRLRQLRPAVRAQVASNPLLRLGPRSVTDGAGASVHPILEATATGPPLERRMTSSVGRTTSWAGPSGSARRSKQHGDAAPAHLEGGLRRDGQERERDHRPRQVVEARRPPRHRERARPSSSSACRTPMAMKLLAANSAVGRGDVRASRTASWRARSRS